MEATAPPEPKPRLLVPYPEAQQLLGGISRTMLHNLIVAGNLNRVAIGRRSFITRDSLHSYVESLTG